MKERILNFLSHVKEAVETNPLEVALSVLFAILACFDISINLFFEKILFLCFPILFFIVYMVNGWTRGSKWRCLYYFSFFLFVPFLFDRIEFDNRIYTVTMIVTQLVYLIRRRFTSDSSFAINAICYANALATAVFLSAIFYILIVIIKESVGYIFDIEVLQSWKYLEYQMAIIGFAVLPILFITLNRYDVENFEFDHESKFINVLFNYLLSPALLIYAAILYVYLAKIIVLWSLPKGGMAYIVMCFSLAAFLLNACQEFLRTYYGWFYKFIGFALLPPLAMYWVGSCYRIWQYGITEPRVYLVVIGIVLTLAAVMFLVKKDGSYYYLCIATIFLFSLVTYIPGITAKELERYSQINRNQDNRTIVDAGRYLHLKLSGDLDIEGYKTINIAEFREWNTGGISYIFGSHEKTDTIFTYDYSKIFNDKMKAYGFSHLDSIPKSVHNDFLTIEVSDSLTVVFRDASIYKSADKDAVSNHATPFYIIRR